MANYTILLVDYEPRSIERSRAPLSRAGYVVHVASDGITALKVFQEIQPNLVLIEAMIPKKHGFEVCQELKRTPEGKRTPVIITTGVYKGRKYRSQALHIYHCDEYVEKPISEDQLLGIVRRFLGEPPSAVVEAEPFDEPIFEIVDDEADSPAAPAVSSEAPVPTRESAPNAAPSVPVSSDPAEREILDRLDAILPGAGSGGARAAVAAVAEPRTAAVEYDVAVDAMVGEVVVDATETPSQIVSFDEARRARKGKKGRRAPKGTRNVIAPAPEPVPMPEEASPPEPVAAPPVARVETVEEPVATEPQVVSRGVPGWVWGVAFVGALVAFYFLVFAN